MTRYKVIRLYANDRDGSMSQTIRANLTLEEAQAWCKDPETSSSTCTNAEGLARTQQHGPWFDGYTQQAGEEEE